MNTPGFKWDIIGHQQIIHFLQRSISNNKIAHAYLFSGAESVGKARVAEYFSASLLCRGRELIPCKKCIFCQQVFKKIHPDLIWIKKEKDKKNISIEQIRNLRKKLTRHSFLNSYKIAIIEQAEILTKEAYNALLKTLEEPTKKTIIILITTNFKNLPATIISRCQLIKFLFVNKQEIYNYFLKELDLSAKKAKISASKAEILACLCQGKPGKGIKFIEDEKLFKEYEIKAKSLFDIIKKNRLKDKFDYLDKIIEPKMNFLQSRENFQNLLSIWSLILRDCLLIKSSNSKFIVNDFMEQELNELAEDYSLTKIKEFLQKIIQTKSYLYYNINPRLAVENLILNL